MTKKRSGNYSGYKGFKFYIIYTAQDSILAFKVGKYSEVKEVMNDLKKFYSFEWDGESLIYETGKDR